ncbi:hypothetical protein CGRA01v4_06058 [Colletotrichum graminicola]|nr:hypothetical protein CGRA01v4_06058 [Colletotrichum graminicola]
MTKALSSHSLSRPSEYLALLFALFCNASRTMRGGGRTGSMIARCCLLVVQRIESAKAFWPLFLSLSLSSPLATHADLFRKRGSA